MGKITVGRQNSADIESYARLPALFKDLTAVAVEGGPHNIAWTHPDIINPALLDFLAS